MMQFLYYVAHKLCHEGMTGKRGENVTEVNMNIVGNGYIPISYGIFIFLRGKIPSLLHF